MGAAVTGGRVEGKGRRAERAKGGCMRTWLGFRGNEARGGRKGDRGQSKMGREGGEKGQAERERGNVRTGESAHKGREEGHEGGRGGGREKPWGGGQVQVNPSTCGEGEGGKREERRRREGGETEERRRREGGEKVERRRREGGEEEERRRREGARAGASPGNTGAERLAGLLDQQVIVTPDMNSLGTLHWSRYAQQVGTPELNALVATLLILPLLPSPLPSHALPPPYSLYSSPPAPQDSRKAPSVVDSTKHSPPPPPPANPVMDCHAPCSQSLGLPRSGKDTCHVPPPLPMSPPVFVSLLPSPHAPSLPLVLLPSPRAPSSLHVPPLSIPPFPHPRPPSPLRMGEWGVMGGEGGGKGDAESLDAAVTTIQSDAATRIIPTIVTLSRRRLAKMTAGRGDSRLRYDKVRWAIGLRGCTARSIPVVVPLFQCRLTKVSAPKVSAPKLSAPKLSAPKLSAPKVSAPKVSAPKLSAPKVSAPKLSAPKVEKGGASLQTPPGKGDCREQRGVEREYSRHSNEGQEFGKLFLVE
ncbi:unnamed protein product [Closterium sp. Naga37s-1]|nr:unnamed protein product [Closterium sp. Naga37s-1]